MAAAAVMQIRTPLQKSWHEIQEAVDQENMAQPPSLSAPQPQPSRDIVGPDYTCRKQLTRKAGRNLPASLPQPARDVGGSSVRVQVTIRKQAHTVTAKPHATERRGCMAKAALQLPNVAAAAGSHCSGVSRPCNVRFARLQPSEVPEGLSNHQSAAEGLLGSKCSQQNRLLEHQMENQLQQHTQRNRPCSQQGTSATRACPAERRGACQHAAVGQTNIPLSSASGAGAHVTLCR